MSDLRLTEVDGNYLVRLSIGDFLAVSLDQHINMLLKEWFCSLQLLTNHECTAIRLRPEEWEGPADLGVRVYVLL